MRRVSVRWVERWRRAWRERGEAGVLPRSRPVKGCSRAEGGHRPDSNRGFRIGANPSAVSWAARRRMAKHSLSTRRLVHPPLAHSCPSKINEARQPSTPPSLAEPIRFRLRRKPTVVVGRFDGEEFGHTAFGEVAAVEDLPCVVELSLDRGGEPDPGCEVEGRPGRRRRFAWSPASAAPAG